MLNKAKPGKQSALVDHTLLESGQLSAATKNFVDLSWESHSLPASFLVYKNDILIAKTADMSFRDVDVNPGEILDYRVETITKLGVFVAEDEPTIRGFQVIVPEALEVTQVSLEQAELKGPSPTGADVVYKTFIPQAKLKAPPVGCSPYNSPYQFGGDNRGYSASSGTSRTKLTAHVKWGGTGLQEYVSSVGATKVYDSKGKLVATKTASKKDIWVKELKQTSTKSDLRFSVKAGNPFCSYNSIQGAFTITLSKSGSYSIISGTHRQMPNHEIYIRHVPGGAWKTVYRKKYASELCLVAMACEVANITGSGKY